MNEYYEPKCSEHIGFTAKKMCDLAKSIEEPVEALFNDVLVIAKNGDTPEVIVSQYEAGGIALDRDGIFEAVEVINDTLLPLNPEWTRNATYAVKKLKAEIQRLQRRVEKLEAAT